MFPLSLNHKPTFFIALLQIIQTPDRNQIIYSRKIMLGGIVYIKSLKAMVNIEAVDASAKSNEQLQLMSSEFQNYSLRIQAA